MQLVKAERVNAGESEQAHHAQMRGKGGYTVGRSRGRGLHNHHDTCAQKHEQDGPKYEIGCIRE